MKADLGIILAHGGAREAVLRHIPVWEESCHRLVFFTPVDDQLRLLDQIEFSVGRTVDHVDKAISDWPTRAYTPEVNLRCRAALGFAAMTKASSVLLMEWDSMVFEGLPPLNNDQPHSSIAARVTAAQFRDPQIDGKFKSPTYLHFPQLYTNGAAEKVVAEMDKLPLDAEHCFTDRYVGLAVHNSGVYVDNLHVTNPSLVFSCNEIGPGNLPDAVKAYRRGARWSHGIKGEETFRVLREAAAVFHSCLADSLRA